MSMLTEMLSNGKFIKFTVPESMSELEANLERYTATLGELRRLETELQNCGVILRTRRHSDGNTEEMAAKRGILVKTARRSNLAEELAYLQGLAKMPTEVVELRRLQTMSWNEHFGCEISHYPTEVITEFMQTADNPYEVERLAGSSGELHVYARPRNGRRGVMTYPYDLTIDISITPKRTAVTVRLKMAETEVKEFSSAELVRLIYEAAARIGAADEELIAMVRRDAGTRAV